jgi:hypothetical protein
MTRHPIHWTAPSPLWPELARLDNGAGHVEFGAPAILRFASDDFMQDFLNVLATDPRKLGEFRAVRETWRGKLGSPTIPTPKKLFALEMQRLGSRLRRTSTGAKATASSDAQSLPLLKLYQPAHMRYYLITACLTCRIAGMPDRKVDVGKQERVSFVMRRLFQPAATTPGIDPDDPKNWDEYAWAKTSTGYTWQSVQNGGQLRNDVVLNTEERLPLFSASCQEDDQRSRRLLAGLIPVGKREAYLGAQTTTTTPDPFAKTLPTGTTRITARKILLRKQVIEPWKALIKQIAGAAAANSTTVDQNGVRKPIPAANISADSVRSAREQAQVISWLILSDFAEFLCLHIPELWESILASTRPPGSFPNMGRVYDALNSMAWLTGQQAALQNEYSVETGDSELPVPANLRLALAQFGLGGNALNTTLRDSLDQVDQPYSREPTPRARDDRKLWPKFLFPLTDPQFGALVPTPPDLGTLNSEEGDDLSIDQIPIAISMPDGTLMPLDPVFRQLDKFTVLLVRALAESTGNSSAPQPEIPTAAIPPEDPSTAIFRIRCVYERPGCGPLHDDVVSDATEPFELAGFFDPDAPARPIRIGLPIDTTPAGLRKFDKNTAFVMSDVLCGQVQRMKSLGFIDLVLSVLPWPLHKDLSIGDMKPCGSPSTNFGMVCSLSIPIITICALILLMIIVTLLDLVFRWLPFFIICFPIPGLKAKKP